MFRQVTKSRGSFVQVVKGDKPGHAFRGNQWTKGKVVTDRNLQEASLFEAGLAREYRDAGITEDTMSAEEAAVLKSYQGSGYEDTNLLLRTNGGVGTSLTAEEIVVAKIHVAKLDTLIARTPPLKEDVVVYRGIGRKAADSMGVRSENANGETVISAKNGTLFVDAGFASTSLVSGAALDFSQNSRIALQVTVPKGSKALVMNTARSSPRMAPEHEVILPRNSKMIVTGMTTVNGYTAIQVSVLP